jgi:hypothetical protein
MEAGEQRTPKGAQERDGGWVMRADEATLAVVAHGLLRSVTIVQGGIETVRRRWSVLDEETRDEILRAAMDHAVLIGASLQDLVRGMCPDNVPSTDEVELSLDEEAPRRAPPSWVPMYANCPRCRYRGVYVVPGRALIRCRYCRSVADLAVGECATAVEHPEQFVGRLLHASR